MQFAKFFLTEYLDSEQTPWSASAEDYVYPSDYFVVATQADGTPVEFWENTWPIQGRERGYRKERLFIWVTRESTPRQIGEPI